MKKTINGLLKLTRFNEYVYFVIFTTLLGIATAGGELDLRFIIVLLANWLAVGFAFMFNDAEDAPDDALSDHRMHRNPVSAGMLTPRAANTASYTAAALATVLYATLGWLPFALGLFCLLLGYIYSYRDIRLKNIALFDLLSHCLMLAGLQTLTGYFAFQDRINAKLLFPFLFVVSISAYSKLSNEIYDFEADKRSLLRHTAIALGKKRAQLLMMFLLYLGIICGAISLFFLEIIPLWVMILMGVLAAIFSIPVLLKLQKSSASQEIQTPLYKTLERAAALGLLMQFMIPWFLQFLK